MQKVIFGGKYMCIPFSKITPEGPPELGGLGGYRPPKIYRFKYIARPLAPNFFPVEVQ